MFHTKINKSITLTEKKGEVKYVKKHIHTLWKRKYSCGLQLSGYPAQDYDSNQIPRKTELCLSLSGQDFEKYISEVLYPNLAGKKFDIYKIDKQRRLIRLAKYTPRAIKDSKYQGSLIIIPYVGILILRGLGGRGHF